MSLLPKARVQKRGGEDWKGLWARDRMAPHAWGLRPRKQREIPAWVYGRVSTTFMRVISATKIYTHLVGGVVKVNLHMPTVARKHDCSDVW